MSKYVSTALAAVAVLLVAAALMGRHFRPQPLPGEGVPAEVTYPDGRVQMITFADVVREASKGSGRAYLDAGPDGGWRYRDDRGVWGKVRVVSVGAPQ